MSHQAICPECQASVTGHVDGTEFDCAECGHRFLLDSPSRPMDQSAVTAVPLADTIGTAAHETSRAVAAGVGVGAQNIGKSVRQPTDPDRFPLWIIFLGLGVVATLIFGGVTLIAVITVLHDLPRKPHAGYGYGYGYRKARPIVTNDRFMPIGDAFGLGRRFEERWVAIPNVNAAAIRPSLVWIDNDSFAVLDEKGTLSLVNSGARDRGFEIKQRPLENPGARLNLSAEGLVVIFAGDRHLQLHDMNSFELVRALELPWQPAELACSPSTALAAVVSQNAEELTIVDVRAGKAVETFDRRSFADAGFLSPVMTSAGDHLLTRNRQGKVLSFRVGGDASLALDGRSTWQEVRSAGRIECVHPREPIAAESWTDRGNQPAGASGMDLFRLDDLKDKSFRFMGRAVTAAAFDPVEDAIYVGTSEGELLQYRKTQDAGWQEPIRLWRDPAQLPPGQTGPIKQLAMNARGDKLLVLAGDGLWVLGPPLQPAAPPGGPRDPRR
jgi:hypothetical protein